MNCEISNTIFCFFSTVCGLLLLLISIMYIYSLIETFDYEYLLLLNSTFRIWLPEADVEAFGVSFEDPTATDEYEYKYEYAYEHGYEDEPYYVYEYVEDGDDEYDFILVQVLFMSALLGALIWAAEIEKRG